MKATTADSPALSPSSGLLQLQMNSLIVIADSPSNVITPISEFGVNYFRPFGYRFVVPLHGEVNVGPTTIGPYIVGLNFQNLILISAGIIEIFRVNGKRCSGICTLR
jgi:hypothetical protein